MPPPAPKLLALLSPVLPFLLAAACRSEPRDGRNPSTPTPASVESFEDVAEEVGLDFVHRNGMRGDLHMVEMVGSGAALLDYDQDGDLDLFLVQGHDIGRTSAEEVVDRLFRNLLVETGRLRLEDVTELSGLRSAGYGQGVAVGDVDGNGYPDLYVTNWGPNQLWRNLGDGTFVDGTEAGVTDDAGWGTSATFLDYDADSDLDLFSVNYVDAMLDNHFQCTSPTGMVDYCGPLAFSPTPDRLLRNRGDGSFEDVTEEAGIGGAAGSGLGVVSFDVDGDGWQDIYVANDQMNNFLWSNGGDGRFTDRSLVTGVAVNGEGRAEASMGVEAADFDGDGDLDIFLTHLRNETNTLYLNDGAGLFSDVTPSSGLGPASLPFTSFGTRAIDLDSDGWLDLLVVNGTVRRIAEQLQAGDPLPLRQANQLFVNLGAGRFEERLELAGEDLAFPRVSRGAAFGDVDNDGDTDVVVTNNNDRPQLLLNRAGDGRRWLGVRLLDGGRDAHGATLELERSDGRRLTRRVQTDGSFLSSHDPRVLFALEETQPRSLTVVWSDGARQLLPLPEAGRYTTLARQDGVKPEPGRPLR